jgi:N-acetylmuramoyl-L-alanine amidase
MDAAAIAGLCAVLAHGGTPAALPNGVTCPPAVVAPARPPVVAVDAIADRLASESAREGIARVSFAEAGNQGDSGLAAVVYTILNRLADGRWGASVDAVLNARDQFEPVMRAGGDWRALSPVSPAQQARIDTIINLALDGRLPDLTNGARYFQNPSMVAARVRSGEDSPGLVNFGGETPSAVIGAHSFYTDARGSRPRSAIAAAMRSAAPDTAIFVGENRAPNGDAAATDPSAGTAPDPLAVTPASEPSRGLFVSRDGVVSEDQP